MSDDDLQALGLLQDPVRRSLYDAVAAGGGEVGRTEAAQAAGVSRTLAGHHLDKLVEAGLLESGFRPQERKGPGSGRPAKVYRRAAGDRSVSLPPRDYVSLASVLAEVVDELGAEERAERAARGAGRRLAGRHGGEPVESVLRGRGYEPYPDDGVLRMRNCPFHVLSHEQPLLVCSMNLALCQGLLEGLGDDPGRARLDPRPGECCVTVSKTNDN
ncbi:helix-turn-helix domain-containing protein [Nonomuraea glycinis]|uniref:ArsR family transcriptional regulator n=1 Tax=Nonomuraea glycinis TaxID=2047744 RepID=A0A918A7R7_9ACTN|nr:helix-turn-helix domain-containing protein [Nonomuraea glycinis]MCA2177363.1 helix-turn-helix domain-containing protein [Nonomuraea glycinis]WSG66507.1 helix-turn-helix domain-containing protein [Nonomuraea glycinis]GGP09147.1 ArsR family transcriptional regulator [Nonomuraea glycinis]